MPTIPAGELVGRDPVLARLRLLVERVARGERVTVVISGEAGIGKSTLLRAVGAHADEQGVSIAWGTCVDLPGAPAYWPWSRAFDEMVRERGASVVREAAGDDLALLSPVLSGLGGPLPTLDDQRGQLLAMDATGRLLDTLAREQPQLILLDDLQWADPSTLTLLDVLATRPGPAPVGIVVAYRHDELDEAARQRLMSLTTRSEQVRLGGLDVAAVRELASRVAGAPITPSDAAALHDQTGGHPFFVRELALHRPTQDDGAVPVAVHDAIRRRVDRLPAEAISVLEALAVVGTSVPSDVLSAVSGVSPDGTRAALRAAAGTALVTTTSGLARFTHDLLRETVAAGIDPGRLPRLHLAAAEVLERRAATGTGVEPSALARHFRGAIAVDGPERAARWSLEAAARDRELLAFSEAASQLALLRAALAAAGTTLRPEVLVDVLLAEADARGRHGSIVDARGLLRHAADLASACGDGVRQARTALAVAQLGAKFSARRDDVLRELERAIDAVRGDAVWEARLSATLARELQHSVAEDRPRARPISERALEAGRRSGDIDTLLTCLVAHHDVLWTPGAAVDRIPVAEEIVAVARRAGDRDRIAEGLLLLANAQLEAGLAAFEPTLGSCIGLLEELGQPRHRYTALTRRACLALVRCDLGTARSLIDEAVSLGREIREPDVDNVRMSQELELVRAEGDPDRLRAFAEEAVAHWIGAPGHSHAVAAGFLARAGDLDQARHHVAVAVELDTWRTDRSYLWSVFVRELAVAAVALDDQPLCRSLYEVVVPVAGSCGVNGAAVAFAGSHAETAATLAGALGRVDEARTFAEDARTTHERLGATAFGSSPPGASERGGAAARIRRSGTVWHVEFGGRAATVAHVKGLADIARLIEAGGAEVPALELMGSPEASDGPDPIADRTALEQYRRRLAELDADIDDAAADNDDERRARAELERESVIAELGRVTGLGGRPRSFANRAPERARKAVSARIREAIRRLEPELPELSSHLERAVVTGVRCRYVPDGTDWQVDLGR